MKVYLTIINNGIEFKSTKALEKCDECDEYGSVERLNYPDKPECGTYRPYCDCEFGKYQKDNLSESDMIHMARMGANERT